MILERLFCAGRTVLSIARRSRALRVLLVSLGFALASSSLARAAVFQVEQYVSSDRADANPGDGICADVANDCTVRAAIMEANALPGLDEVRLNGGLGRVWDVDIPADAPGTEEAVGDLDVTDDILIEATGFAGIGGGWSTGQFDRTLHVSGAITATIRNLHILGGQPAAGNALGGGILVSNGASLNLENVVVEVNRAAFGAGLACESGTVSVSGGRIITNEATVDGGGLYVGSGCVVDLSMTEVSANEAVSRGGAVVNDGGTLTAVNTTIYDNVALIGGAVFQASTGTTLLRNATVTRNGHLDGSSTVGGIFTQSAGGVEIRNTILSRNLPNECSGATLTATGTNVVFNDGGGAGCIVQGGVLASNPLLDEVARTNVYTITTPILLMPTKGARSFALSLGSPAIDAASCESGLVVDQRGVARPSGSSCDIGAFEVPVCGDSVIEPPETCEGSADPTCDAAICRLIAPSDDPHAAPASTKTITGGLVVAYQGCDAASAHFPTHGSGPVNGCSPPLPRDPANPADPGDPDPFCAFQDVGTAKGSYTVTRKANGEITFEVDLAKLVTSCAGQEFRIRATLNETVEDCRDFSFPDNGESYPCTIDSQRTNATATVLLSPTCVVSATGACVLNGKLGLDGSGSVPEVGLGRRTSIELRSFEVVRIVKDAQGNPIDERTAFVPGVFSP